MARALGLLILLGLLSAAGFFGYRHFFSATLTLSSLALKVDVPVRYLEGGADSIATVGRLATQSEWSALAEAEGSLWSGNQLTLVREHQESWSGATVRERLVLELRRHPWLVTHLVWVQEEITEAYHLTRELQAPRLRLKEPGGEGPSLVFVPDGDSPELSPEALAPKALPFTIQESLRWRDHPLFDQEIAQVIGDDSAVLVLQLTPARQP
jgi:hypothetical protein